MLAFASVAARMARGRTQQAREHASMV